MWKNRIRPLQDYSNKYGSVTRHNVIIGESGLDIGYAGAIDLMAGGAIGSIDLKPGSEDLGRRVRGFCRGWGAGGGANGRVSLTR